MIEINLLPVTGKKKKKSSAAASFPVSIDDLKALVARVKDPLLIGAIAAWVVAILVVGALFISDRAKMASMNSELERVQSEQRRFAALIKQKRQAEMLRDSLISELNVIRGIDAERFVWPHIFEEVTRALPDYTWLVGLEPIGARRNQPGQPSAPQAPVDSTDTGVKFTVEGRTSDIQAYTRFLRQLANSPWITDIVAGPTTTAIEENRPVTAFSLTATFHQADSGFVRMAPLVQTLR